jgi:hypothetical protein
MVGLEKADVSHLKPAGLEQHGLRISEAYRKLVEPSGAASRTQSRLKAIHDRAFE